MKAVVLTLVVLSSAVASAESLRAKVATFDKAVSQAMKKKDFVALKRIMKAGVTSDFVYEEDGRKQTFDQMFENMKMGLGAMSKITLADAQLLSLRETGNTAAGKSRHRMGGSSMGPDKKMHTMTFSGISSDTYVKQGGQWKLRRMSMKTESMQMDGKSMDPSGMGGK